MSQNTIPKPPFLRDIFFALAIDYTTAGHEYEQLAHEVPNKYANLPEETVSPEAFVPRPPEEKEDYARLAEVSRRFNRHPIFNYGLLVEMYGGPGRDRLSGAATKVSRKFGIVGLPAEERETIYAAFGRLDDTGKTQIILDRLLGERPDARELLAPFLEVTVPLVGQTADHEAVLTGIATSEDAFTIPLDSSLFPRDIAKLLRSRGMRVSDNAVDLFLRNYAKDHHDCFEDREPGATRVREPKRAFRVPDVWLPLVQHFTQQDAETDD